MDFSRTYSYPSISAAADALDPSSQESGFSFQHDSVNNLFDRYLSGKPQDLDYRPVPVRLKKSIRPDLGGLQDQSGELPVASLCSACSAIFNNDYPDSWFEESHAHYISRADVELAVHQGCQICSMIKDALAIKRPDWISSRGTPPGLNGMSGMSYEIEIEAWTGDRLVFRLDGKLLLDLQMLHADDTDKRINRDNLSQTTKSKQPLDLARHWLSTCRMSHYTCGDIPAGRTRCPTRLLEIESSAGSITAKLWCSDDHPNAMPAYLTLSHCWGKLDIFKLTTDKIRRLKNSIPLNLLPQVFRDALQVTVELGYQYLWIDSLCICQDSASDWIHESSIMDTVYREADCNIAATGFSDGQNGLFVQRDWNSIYPKKVLTRWTGRWSGGGQPRLQCYFIADDKIWKTGVDNAPLNKRCWVLQERLLSPCTLHFGDQQLFWECSEAICCELYPTGFPRDLYASSVKFGFNHHSSTTSFLGHRIRLSEDFRRRRVHPVHPLWQKTVQTYTNGKLTCPNDRIIAIAGAAKQFKKILCDDYLAGLWKRHILRDLLWSVKFNSTVTLQPALMAPSWSWFSVDAELMFIAGSLMEESSVTEHSVVQEACVDTIGHNEFGALGGGRLKIRGPLALLALDQLSYYTSDWTVNDQTIELDIVYDVCGKLATPIESCKGPLIKEDDSGQYSVSMTIWHAALLLGRRPLFVLPLITDEDLETGRPYMKGLLLGHCDGIKGQYIRLGIWTAETEEAKNLLLQKHEKLSNEFFLDFDGTCMYTIDII